MASVSALLALCSSLLWGTSDFVAGLKSKTLPPAAVVGWSQLVGFLTLCVVVVFMGNPLTASGWQGWAVASGVAGAVALAAFYAALSTGTMSVVAPVASLGAALPVLLGVATGDTPSPIAWVGMGVAVLGTVLASGPEIRSGLPLRPVLLAGGRGRRVRDRPVLHRPRCPGVPGLDAVGYAADQPRPVCRSWPRFAGRPEEWRRRDWPTLVFIGLADLSANALFVTASTRGLVSVAAVLGSLYPVVTILLARAILAERLRVIQNVGVVLAMAGVVAIATG